MLPLNHHFTIPTYAPNIIISTIPITSSLAPLTLLVSWDIPWVVLLDEDDGDGIERTGAGDGLVRRVGDRRIEGVLGATGFGIVL